jgi:tetratricopeptide (TPR) repeat protein
VLCDSLNKPVEAEAAFRRAIALESTHAHLHHNLGVALEKQGRLKDAEDSLRRALQEVSLENWLVPRCYNKLGTLLAKQNRLPEAMESYRQAIAHRPDYPEAHCGLGLVLKQAGRFSEALAEVRAGHAMGAKRKDWNNSSADWVRELEQLVAAEAKLPRVLAGEIEPDGGADWLSLAYMCHHHKKRFVGAAELYAGAFAADPKLTEILDSHRYDAACAAALAGCGQGEDATKLDDAERVRLRRQALDWLAADFAAWTKLADNASDRPRLRDTMRHWQIDPDFACIRGDEALARMPEAERAAWQKLWADVADLLKRTDDPKPPDGSPPKP